MKFVVLFHAEQNAIIQASTCGADISGATL